MAIPTPSYHATQPYPPMPPANKIPGWPNPIQTGLTCQGIEQMQGTCEANSGRPNIAAAMNSIGSTMIRCHQISDRIAEYLTGPEVSNICDKPEMPPSSLSSSLSQMDQGCHQLESRLQRIAKALGIE